MRTAQNRHGTYAKARTCHCAPCKAEIARYRKRLRVDADRGVSRRIDAEPVRRHLQRLVDQGLTHSQIAHATGDVIDRCQVKRLLTCNAQGKPVKWVHRKTAAAILQVRPADADEGRSLVSTLGVRRRIQALHRLGLTKDDVARHLGISQSHVSRQCLLERIYVDSAERYYRAYEELSNTTGTSETMRWRAIRNGWPPPMAWDGLDIDDPDEQPDWADVLCAVENCTGSVHKMGCCKIHWARVERAGVAHDGRLFRMYLQRLRARNNRDVVAENITDLLSQGVSIPRIAVQLGYPESHLRNLISRIPELKESA